MWSLGDTVNTVLAGTGLTVAIVGLGAVYWQIRRTASMAQAARRAAVAARETIVQRVTAADLGSVNAGLDALQNELRAGQREAALLSCQGIRRQLVALRSRSAPRLPTEMRIGLQWTISTLTKIREALEGTPEITAPALDITATNSDIERMIDLVVEWRESPLSLEPEEFPDD